MYQFNIAIEEIEDGNLGIKKIVKKRKLNDFNKDSININIDSYKHVINTITNKIEKLDNDVNKNNKDDKIDIIFELYRSKFLSSERLQFIIKHSYKNFNISSNLVKKLMEEDENVYLLDDIFTNLKFYDNDFILRMLIYYKNKKAISVAVLNQQISNEKFRILVNTDCLNNSKRKICNKIDKYLINECNKKNINIHIIKFLVEHGANLNSKDKFHETPLFGACSNGNEAAVKYLVKHGAIINERNYDNETILFNACKNGNEVIVKYLVEHGADINSVSYIGETALFNACKSESEAIVKYLVEQGAEVNIEDWNGYTPLSIIFKKGNEVIVKYLVDQGADINKTMDNG